MKTKANNNRIRVTPPVFEIKTREEAEETLGQIAGLTLERNAAQICLDDEIARLREEHGEKISELNLEIEGMSSELRQWAEANPDEFPKGKKSIEMLQGTIGFRTGTPKLKTIGRKTWAAVLATIKRSRMTSWIRVEETVNKEQIIADARGAQDAEVPRAFIESQMKRIGVRVVQDESFFIEPRLEELETRRTA